MVSDEEPENEEGEGLFTQEGEVRLGKMIGETEQRLMNTRAFLENLRDPEARDYVEGLKTTLEHEVRRLERERAEREGDEEE